MEAAFSLIASSTDDQNVDSSTNDKLQSSDSLDMVASANQSSANNQFSSKLDQSLGAIAGLTDTGGFVPMMSNSMFADGLLLPSLMSPSPLFPAAAANSSQLQQGATSQQQQQSLMTP